MSKLEESWELAPGQTLQRLGISYLAGQHNKGKVIVSCNKDGEWSSVAEVEGDTLTYSNL